MTLFTCKITLKHLLLDSWESIYNYPVNVSSKKEIAARE